MRRAATKRNMWPFGAGQALGSRSYSYDVQAARESAQEEKRAKPAVKARYRGYTIYQTSNGEYFSSLDRDSWYERLVDVKRAIDQYKKGRAENPAAKSKGHLFFKDGAEWYKAGTEVYRAPLSSVFENGYRLGRWEFPGWQIAERKKHGVYPFGKSNPAKFDRCVKEVQAKGGDVNAYAVCTAAGTRGNPELAHSKELSASPAVDDMVHGPFVRVSAYTPVSIIKIKGTGKRARLFIEADLAGKPYWGWVDPNDIRQNPKRRNPEADAAGLYRSFHGKPPEETVEIHEDIEEHGWLGNLGELTEIFVDTPTGYRLHLEWSGKEDTPFLAANEDGTQLYVKGGKQSVDLAKIKMDDADWVKDRMVLGEFSPPDPCSKCGGEFVYSQKANRWQCSECKHVANIEPEKGPVDRVHNITYHTEKDFDEFQPIDYQHSLGEETGDVPTLEYDPRNELLFIAGGRYRIKQPLLETSPGIEN